MTSFKSPAVSISFATSSFAYLYEKTIFSLSAFFLLSMLSINSLLALLSLSSSFLSMSSSSFNDLSLFLLFSTSISEASIPSSKFSSS